ncbi:MAG TPA: hypothetical protein VK013_01050 [Myxococcaceae bacterium]|nr:hypothetical protein [Myxococcaceae bacterium]
MNPSPTRLQPLQFSPNAGRTTPQRDFGQFLSQAAGTISSVVDLSLRAAVPGGVVSGVSLATGAARQVAGLVSTPSPMNQVAPLTVSTPAPERGFGAPALQGGLTPSAPANGTPGEMLETQRLMQLESFAFNQQYLQLQSEMQRESRQFTAVSNVMKVRHDSAKASINNVR